VEEVEEVVEIDVVVVGTALPLINQRFGRPSVQGRPNIFGGVNCN
jgi:hypothetical protein